MLQHEKNQLTRRLDDYLHHMIDTLEAHLKVAVNASIGSITSDIHRLLELRRAIANLPTDDLTITVNDPAAFEALTYDPEPNKEK